MISIILPAYNEEKNIGFVIDSVTAFFNKKKLAYEMIVINDGSKDGTGEVLSRYGKMGNISVISHAKNLGYGAALRSGFNTAKGDLIFFTDSDRQFNIEDIGPFLDKIKENDFIIGYRKNRKDPFIRIAYAWIFNFCAKIFFGVKVKDIDCAFKLFKKYVLSDMELISTGALINLEILSKAKKRKLRFIELPVNHYLRKEGEQTGGSFRIIVPTIFNFFCLVLSDWLKVPK